jgi:ubiquinone/menaquinone biosynthesis C-methylase UbiE
MIIRRLKNLCLPLLAFLLLAVSPAAQSARELSFEKRSNARQPPDKVMNTIGVKPGMVIGEIGAGRGRYTVHLAERVGDSGKVYANDIDENVLSYLRDRCRRNAIRNIETILGEVDDPLFPGDSLDMAFMVWVYHHLDEPVALLENLKLSLKPGATVVILDPAVERGGERDSPEATTREKVERDAGEAGYELVRVEEFLPRDNIFILKIKDS